jgi:hypothetical protein
MATNHSLTTLLPGFPPELERQPLPDSLTSLPAEIRDKIWQYSMNTTIQDGVDAWAKWGQHEADSPKWTPANPSLCTLLLNRACSAEGAAVAPRQRPSIIKLKQRPGESAFASLQGIDNTSVLFKGRIKNFITTQVIKFPVQIVDDNHDDLINWADDEAGDVEEECVRHLRRHYHRAYMRTQMMVLDESKNRYIVKMRFAVRNPRRQVRSRDEAWVKATLRKRRRTRE